MTPDTLNPPAPPAEASAECGYIGVWGIAVFPVDHWIEDGDHVFRSADLPVIAGDPDLQAAVELFAEKVQDLFSYLLDLPDRTENEAEILATVSGYMRKVLQELERREKARHRRVIGLLLRRRAEHERDWIPRSGPTKSRQQSPV